MAKNEDVSLPSEVRESVAAYDAAVGAVGKSLDVDHDDRLIRWMLERTPAQRLEALQSFVDGVAALRHARKIGQ